MPVETIFGLYEFSDHWNRVSGFKDFKSIEGSQRRDVIASRLGDLEPSWKGTDLGTALVQTVLELQEAQSEFPSVSSLRILLASDLQVGSKLDALREFDWPADMNVELIVVTPDSTSNAGIQSVERNAESNDDAIRVRIVNSSDSRTESFQLKWQDDEASMNVYVPAGESRIVRAPEPSAERVTSILEIVEDDHDFDNRVYLPPRTIDVKRVGYIGADFANDTEGMRFYLEGVFQASPRFEVDVVDVKTGFDFEQSKATRNPPGKGSDPLEVAGEDQPPFRKDSHNRQPFDLIVLTDSVPGVNATISNHLSSGGTLLMVARSVESGLECLKLCEIPDTGLTEATGQRDSMLEEIDFEHSLFMPFSESRFSDFTGIRFWKHRRLDLQQIDENENESKNVNR
ncbi:MAG: hypothetical protein FJ267_15895, partial [Planctomycetes bacterium]|nr:hypothetical protein [Planctomycetota bacterium]